MQTPRLFDRPSRPSSVTVARPPKGEIAIAPTPAPAAKVDRGCAAALAGYVAELEAIVEKTAQSDMVAPSARDAVRHQGRAEIQEAKPRFMAECEKIPNFDAACYGPIDKRGAHCVHLRARMESAAFGPK
ncbi:MAG: hypothetical protein IPG04_24800 [Polyangiaceae bacterium]|nr:hypothetical protein [Polyangiaceae bacterium]